MTFEQLTAGLNVSVLAPEIWLTVFAMLVLLAGAFLKPTSQKSALPLLALVGVVASGTSAVALWNRNLTFGPGETAIYGADNFSLFFHWIFLLGLGVSVLLSGRFMQARGGDRGSVGGEYLGLMMLSTVGMMMVAGARDLLVVFLGIETLSIALYVLAGFARTRLLSNEAALKYFLLGAFASGFLLYGIALTYYAVGSTSLPVITQLVTSGSIRSAEILYVGLALLLIGLGFKAALVPFHQWTPDVYEGSPTPVTAFMATGAKAAAFAALMRVFGGAFVELAPQLHFILVAIAVFTMTIGNVIALSQESVKRMLAYSSVAHAGYLLIGVVAASSAAFRRQSEASSNATAAVLFYLLCYAVMNLGAFAVLVYLENAHGQRNATSSTRNAVREVGAPRDRFDSEDANLTMGDLAGLGARRPVMAAAMTLFLLSLAGIPPLAGFFGKLAIFNAAIGQGMWGLVVVGAINTVISVYYYLRPVVAMYMNADESEIAPSLTSSGLIVPASGEAIVPSSGGEATIAARSMALPVGAITAIVICAVAVVAMLILQNSALGWAQQATSSFIVK